MECSFWEFGAIVRHEKARRENGGAGARRRFDIPAFVTSRDSGLAQPEDPVEVLEAAEKSVRAKKWITGGRLSDEWYEIVTALAQGHSLTYLYLTEPDQPETRAMAAVSNLAFRIVLRGDRVWIDEVATSAAERSVVECLPDVNPANGRSVLLPTELLAAAALEAENHKADQGDWIAYELGKADIDPADAREVGRLAKLADRVIGQFNVISRDDVGRKRVAPWAITVHHNSSGRVAQIPQPPDGVEVLVAPGDVDVIAAALRTYHEEARSCAERP
ncbi:EspG family protein [Saccharopolyspora antimicrobica]|uniref:EspG family protein n=1 Tax=Saccharopolyspora antimicrobica TaxID=455193 RepID=A0A1I5KDQ6_9PSEU|nr:ESX secretion-associated protein EspG [Saccharopolyspora antimicrobica]RKT81964.1 ESAT-6 protein secretion system EspG family protein [Saccharopolyspora antimicrobica]SFO83108.1 EspG family protein [Saccharopolyspora antimicrobica]